MKIAVTGGIGSGKSYICRQLSHKYGWPIYDCDTEAKRLNEESPVIREGLIEMVGDNVYDSDGHLDRRVLADFLFANVQNAQRVNALIHPVVKEDFLTWAEQQGGDVLVETAILQESGMDAVVDRVIRVDASLETRVQRAMQRDGATREQIMRRIAMQREYPNPDEIIYNE